MLAGLFVKKIFSRSVRPVLTVSTHVNLTYKYEKKKHFINTMKPWNIQHSANACCILLRRFESLDVKYSTQDWQK